MTAHPDSRRNAGEIVSDMVDTEPSPRPSEIDVSSLDQRQVRDVADLLLVHSLLVQKGLESDITREKRVRRAMDGIARKSFGRFLQPVLRYGIAAMLAIAAVFFFTRLPANNAMAAVDQMIAAIDHAGDRTYSIRVIDSRREPVPQAPRQPGERAGLDGATLYLRGSDKFVLVRKTPSGKDLINGSDGQTRWLVRPGKSVLVSDDPQAFRIPLPPELAEILSLDLKSTLVHIRDHYKASFLAQPPAGQPQDGTLKYIDAAKASRDIPGPQNIEIWADAQTGLLVRIEFAGIHLQGDPAPKRLVITLADQKQLPDGWFTHESHHDSSVPVEGL